MLDHHLHESAEVDPGLPSEDLPGLGRIAEEDVDLGRPRVPGVEFDEVPVVQVDKREGDLQQFSEIIERYMSTLKTLHSVDLGAEELGPVFRPEWKK